MRNTFTVRDILRTGGPLEGAEVMAGESRLDSPVTWAVSLRPYVPAIPPIKGNEVALAAVDILHRQGIELSSVIERLVELGATGLAMRGAVDSEALLVARKHTFPLLKITGDAPLHEIEQEIIREVAFFYARREIEAPSREGEWIESLLTGQYESAGEIQALARLEEYVLPPTISVGYLLPAAEEHIDLARVTDLLNKRPGKYEALTPARQYVDGVVLILSPNSEEKALEQLPPAVQAQLAYGVGSEMPLAKAAESFEEARLAVLVSARLRRGTITRHAEMGADRLLALLYKDKPEELQRFVNETLGPLFEHDTRYATNLVSTVESFVGNAGRLRETAGEIFVHRNTLAYRLQRASYLLGKDLKDADAQLAIQMALRARRFLMSPTGKDLEAGDEE